jgi:predicted GH43/DUF377 family glycosyl hydrolase
MPPDYWAKRPCFTVVQLARLQLTRTSPLTEMYTLSPFVWCGRLRYELLLRAVNHSEVAAEKVARIYFGHSEDGLRFTMGDHPVIAPGPGDDDQDGCEDPTVVVDGDTTYVYYSGWNQTALRGAASARRGLGCGTSAQAWNRDPVLGPSDEPEGGVDRPRRARDVPLVLRVRSEQRLRGGDRVGPRRGRALDSATAHLRIATRVLGCLAPQSGTAAVY